jgi:putative colanic acid biosynthesis acetyltransferase WcaF
MNEAKPLKTDKLDGAFAGAPSFGLRHRLVRAVWSFVWLTLASWTPPPLHRWRIFLLRVFGAKVPYSAFLYGSARIWYPPHLTMHERATLGPGVNCYCMGKIEVGAYAIVSQGAYLCSGTHNFHTPAFQIYAKPINIGADAWVCAEAFVGPGVKLGHGAVLGARAVTFEDLEPWSVYIGNPAKRKSSRTRFDR